MSSTPVLAKGAMTVMPELVIGSVVLTCGVCLWLLCATLCNPQPVVRLLELVAGLRARSRGPKASGLPIEQIAADLRRLIREYERLVRPDADWHRAHHLRACEIALYTRAEEAATALGLPPTSATAGRTAEDLTERLRQLSRAGLALPEIAEMGGDRF